MTKALCCCFFVIHACFSTIHLTRVLVHRSERRNYYPIMITVLHIIHKLLSVFDSIGVTEVKTVDT